MPGIVGSHSLPFGGVNQADLFTGGIIICVNHMEVSLILGVLLLCGLGLSLSPRLGLSLSRIHILPIWSLLGHIRHMQTNNLSASR